MPEIEIPVRKSTKWLDDQFEQAELRVWCDGERQPIDQLEKIDVQSGKTVLRGRGAIELKDPVEVQYSQKPIHEAAQELIEEHTSYTANVDEPNVEVESNVTISSVNTQEEFLNEFDVRETDPIDISNGSIKPYATCHPGDAVDDSNVSPNCIVHNQDWFSGGKALGLESSDAYVIFGSVEFPYRIPAEYFGIKVRDWTLNASDISFRWNDVEFARNTESSASLKWREIGHGSAYDDRGGYHSRIGQDIAPGEKYYFKIKAEGACDYRIDSLAFYDRRFNYTWDNSTQNGDYLDGPEVYPERLWLSSREIPLTRTLVGGTMDAEMNDTSHLDGDGGVPQVGFSPTQGVYYLTSSQDAADPSISGPWNDLQDPSGSVIIGLALGRWGDEPDRQRIPRKGFNPHTVDSYEFTGDLSTLPIVMNRSYNQSLREVLQDLANRGNFIWEYKRDPKTGEQSIEWTQIGQRESSVNLDELQYTITKDSTQVVQQTAVYGSSRDYIARVEATVGSASQLPHTRIQELTETVRDPQTGERYKRGDDYQVDYEDGTITPVSKGLMTSGNTYEVEYTFQTYAEYELDGVPDPVRLPPQDIAGLASNSACAQAARTLIDFLKEPRYEAEITIPQETVQWTLSDALDVDGLDTGGRALKIRQQEHNPHETILTLGIGREVGEIIRDIENRVGNISRNS